VSDRLHLTAADSDHELIDVIENSEFPVASRRYYYRRRRSAPGQLCQHSHELHDTPVGGLLGERIGRCQSKDVAATTDHHLGLERQPTFQLGAKLRLTDWFADDKRAGRANVDDVILFKLRRQFGWADSSMPANVDALKENGERHDSCDRLVTSALRLL